MEKKLRTREEVEALVRADFPQSGKEIIDALTTISLTREEMLADLRKNYPNTPEEILEKFAKDDENLAHSAIDSTLELGEWDYTIKEIEEGEI